VDTTGSSDTGIGIYSTLGLSFVALAVGLFVSAIILAVTCVPSVAAVSPVIVIGCTYPFQGYSAAFLLASALVALLAAAMFTREREVRRGMLAPDRLSYVRFIFFGACAAIGYVLFAFIV
jgi:hypothetical protein